jgi:hypothetical protein
MKHCSITNNSYLGQFFKFYIDIIFGCHGSNFSSQWKQIFRSETNEKIWCAWFRRMEANFGNFETFMNGKQKNIEQVVMLQQSKFDMDWKHILPFNSLPKKRI